MESYTDQAVSNILARLLENETRYNHRLVQSGILQAEMAQLRIQGDQLMLALQTVWPRQQSGSCSPGQNNDRAKVTKLRGRLQNLCSQARTSRQNLPIDTSSRRVIDSIIQQLSELHRESCSIAVDEANEQGVVGVPVGAILHRQPQDPPTTGSAISAGSPIASVSSTRTCRAATNDHSQEYYNDITTNYGPRRSRDPSLQRMQRLKAEEESSFLNTSILLSPDTEFVGPSGADGASPWWSRSSESSVESV